MKYSAILLTSLVLAGCGDKALERRITALERRVAELEQQGSPQAVKTSVNTPSVVSDNTGSSQGTTVNKPSFRFEHSEFDFGTINEGEIVEHLFRFTNVGTAPLVIKKASASCGCTVPSSPKDPIQPGESSEIKVRFDSSNKPNQQVKTITIEANTDPVLTKLQIKGFVIPKNQSNPGN
ncbi:MAG TPA: DUF1573 domain-containing protein [Cyclobacteriaceae bacterium]|nr:DUF1573 domain-containing protein [Cyclobacteriaceae bacterium]